MDFSQYPQFPGILPPETDENEPLSARYAKRREMQEIIPGLFLGPYAVAAKNRLEYLQMIGITHILCIRGTIEAKIVKPNFPDNFQYFVLDVADKNCQNIIQYFPQVKQFIDHCLQSSGKVLVHGIVGFSRSAAMIIAYLMETFQLTYEDALKYVCERRPCCSPNVGFQQQLKEFEYIVKARQQIQAQIEGNLQCKQMQERSKRKFAEVT